MFHGYPAPGAVEPHTHRHGTGHRDAAGHIDPVDAEEVVQDHRQDQPHHDAVEEGVPHDEHRVARAGGQGVVGEHGGIEQLADDLDAQVDHRPALHLRGGGEDHGELRGEELGHHDDHRRQGQGQLQAGLHHLLCPVEEAGPKALSAHGAAAGGEGGDKKLAEVADLVGHAVGRRDGDAVLVDQGQHHQPGDGGDGPLEGGGEAQLQDALDHAPLRTEPAGQQAQIRPMAETEDQSSQAGYRLPQHGGQGGPGHAPAEHRHEEDVQHHVEAYRDDDAVQRDAGVAHAPQGGRHGVVGENEEKTGAADGEIGGGLVQGRGLEQHQQGPAQQGHQSGEEQPE